MTVVKWAFVGLLLLPAVEFVVFVAVAMTIGWFWAAFLFVATSAIGVMLLRRSGRQRLRAGGAGNAGSIPIRLDGPGVGPLIGGILLVFPGFVTDVAGALMLIGPLRRLAAAAIARAIKQPRRRDGPAVIDLLPEEWHQVSERSLNGKRRRRPSGR